MRQVRKESTRRKLLSSESDSEDPDKTMEVQHQVNNNDETNSEKDDVFQDFDRFLKEGSSQETKPVVKTPAWLEDAKNLNAEERSALLERITKELEGCVGGNVKRNPMLLIMITLSELFQETQHRRTINSDTIGSTGLSKRLQEDSILSKGLPRILENNSEKVESQERFNRSNKVLIADPAQSTLQILVILTEKRPSLQDRGDLVNIQEDTKEGPDDSTTCHLYTRNSYLYIYAC